MLVVKQENAKVLFVEMANRLESVEVKGDSVEQLFRIRLALKAIIESLDEIDTDSAIKLLNEKQGGG